MWNYEMVRQIADARLDDLHREAVAVSRAQLVRRNRRQNLLQRIAPAYRRAVRVIDLPRQRTAARHAARETVDSRSAPQCC